MIQPDLFSSFPEVICGFSDRGDGNVSFKMMGDAQSRANREAFFERLGIAAEDVILTSQKHSSDVHLAEASHKGLVGQNASPFESADGLVTGESGVFTTVFSADCLPIFFYEPQAQITASVHAGWRGLAGRIIEKTIDLIRAQGGAGEELRVWIGPHIKVCHYRLDPTTESYATKRRAFPDQTGDFLDLTREAVRQLAEQGVTADHLEIGECTACHPEKYFSYHAAAGQPGGIMMGVIGRRM